MNVGEMKEIIKDLSNDTKIRINSVCDEETGELRPSKCSGFYHKDKNEVYLTPEVIRVPGKSDEELQECAQRILDLFKDLLEENDITIPDEDRKGEEGEDRLYGMTYFALEDEIVDVLNEYNF